MAWNRACLPASAAFLLLLTGCSAKPSMTTPRASGENVPAETAATEPDVLAGPRVKASDEPQVRVVNTKCPIMEERTVSESGMCNADLTRRLSDKTVGFCCADCLSTWDGMSEIEKHLALRRVTPPPIRPEPPPAKSGATKKPEATPKGISRP